MGTRRLSVAFHWSGGKDSAHALGRLLGDEKYDVRCLLTTVHGPDCVSTVHEVPVHLLRAQAEAIGLPLRAVRLSGDGLHDYADVMRQVAGELHQQGVRACGFGDLEVSGSLAYRESLFSPAGLSVLEPLWGLTSADCMDAFLDAGIEAKVVVVDAGVLGKEHLGRTVDRDFVASLPEGCDPSGELGEYHSFVVDAPYFRHRITARAERIEQIRRQIGTHDGVRTFGYWQLRLS